jgi:hypothetical protein
MTLATRRNVSRRGRFFSFIHRFTQVADAPISAAYKKQRGPIQIQEEKAQTYHLYCKRLHC